MSSIGPPICLYNFTLQKPGVITHAIYGNFSDSKAQEIVVARGKYLEFLRPDENGKVVTILSVEIFGIIRSLIPFRLTGSNTDYIIVGSDSGKIVVLEFNGKTNKFDKVHEETYGRSGCRRIVPGQYLATDPKGRAVMIAAIEKQKFVYILNRDSSNNLTISSPLSAHKSSTIIFDVVGVDVSFDNPLYACLELDYEESDNDPTGESFKNAQKHLTFYELDLGLNHVTRQSSEPIERSAHRLITVPGGKDGPGGVLVLAEDTIIYRTTDHKELRISIPRRVDIPRNKGLLITSLCTVKQKDWFFFLIQSEYGDLYKVTIEYEEETAKALNVKYFDTVPIATSLAFLKTGFLFVAAESSNHTLYQFKGIGNDDEDLNYTIDDDEDHVYFNPRPLKNLVVIDEMQSMSPLVSSTIMNIFGEETPQILSLCGKGPRSSLRILRHGVSITERAVSELPGTLSSVFTVKNHVNEEFHRFIIVSFVNATMVLMIGDKVEEVQDSGFDLTVPTINAGLIGVDSLIQIQPFAIRLIRSDGRITEWKPPSGKKILLSTLNSRQVAVALEGGVLVYFELDSGALVEIERTEIAKEITALGLPPIPEGRQRSRFLAVADHTCSIRVFSLDPNDLMRRLALQTLHNVISSINMVEMISYGTNHLYLTIGTVTGVCYRSVIDLVTGRLSPDTRAMFFGSRPVKLYQVQINGENAVMALSSRSWITYHQNPKLTTVPLSTHISLESVTPFCSEQCPEGIVGIFQNQLIIFSIDRLEEPFNQTLIPLRYTPRRLITHPLTYNVLVIESDNDSYPYQEKQKMLQSLNLRQNLEDDEEMPESVYGVPRPGDGIWGSCLRILDIVNGKSFILELENNECAVSITTCKFLSKGNDVFVIMGTVKDLEWYPKRSFTCGYLHVYLLENEGNRLNLVHKTEVEDIPLALCEYQGKLAAGIGRTLRLYDLGKKKLLRKCETKAFLSQIVTVWVSGDRIVVGEQQESFHFVKYSPSDNKIFPFADDTIPRWITTGCMLDQTTLIGADKFGNIFILRLPEGANEEIEEDPTGGAMSWGTNQIIGAPYKFINICNFHIGETVTQIVKTKLTPGANEFLLYTTIHGTIGALLPLRSKEDIDFFSTLEMHMRQKMPPLCGRDHLSYRSYYIPVKGVVDGDLCEQFFLLTPDSQREVGDELERTPSEVEKKLEDMRYSI